MAKKSSGSELGRGVDSKQVGMGTWLGVGARSNQSRSRFQKFVNGCNLPLILPYLLPWYWVTMNRRLDWEIRNAIETNTSVVNWEIHLRYTWCWVTMNRRLDWEIRNAGETNTSVVKVRNTLDKNLAKLGEDTFGVPTAMLMIFFKFLNWFWKFMHGQFQKCPTLVKTVTFGWDIGRQSWNPAF